MACKCLSGLENKILEQLSESKKDLKIHEGEFANRGYKLGGDDDGSGLYFQFEYKYQPVKKDGKLGYEKTGKISIYPTFCGFCGKPFNEEQNEKDLAEVADEN